MPARCPSSSPKCGQPVDSSRTLNLGQNRWYGRLGLPIVWQTGAWVPGRRTTFEILPSVWLFGENDDFVGRTLKTDPMYRIDAHLTRDFPSHLWGVLDLVWYKGGGSLMLDCERHRPEGELDAGLRYTNASCATAAISRARSASTT